MTCQHHHDGAAYVLGALDPADRARFESHLPGCAECGATVSGLAQLPGVLAHAPIEDMLAEGAAPPADTLAGLIRRVRVDRRQRKWRTALVAAAAAVLVSAGSLSAAELLRPEPESPPIVAQPDSIDVVFAPVEGFDVQGDAALTRFPGGTQIRIDCAYTVKDSYLGGLPYRLVVTNGKGDDDVAGSWHAKDGLSEGITLFTRWSPENIAAMEIQDLEGKTILRWER
ncbi:zf-HC2 domain-containing protein [Phytomonospora sp. NPDC050363]|uniref:anti-sigma factor family protein n=1 Tax=Phytomonospora sp. NPDC050363 TaxID=3155642 RepID=UPI0033E871C7